MASTNPVKVKAVENGFKKVFPQQTIEFITTSVSSNVADQPMSDSETLSGAKNRALNAKNEVKSSDYWVGVEGGLEYVNNELSSFSWVFVTSSSSRGQAKTGTYFLPDEVARLIKEGKELGEANDILFEKTNSKQGEGAVGIFTKGIINRIELYEEAVVLALIPFIHPDLFEKK